MQTVLKDSRLLKLEKNITAVMRRREMFWLVRYHTDVLKEVYCPRKISSSCLKNQSKNVIEPDSSLIIISAYSIYARNKTVRKRYDALNITV